jgi:hypothetical protein
MKACEALDSSTDFETGQDIELPYLFIRGRGRSQVDTIFDEN